MKNIDTSIIIVGGGPVGLTLAIYLAQQGVHVTVIETRQRGEPPSVKCNHVAARSMELFRRLGVAQVLRNAGLPEDYPNDIAYRTTMVGQELTRIRIPCRRDRYTASNGPDTGWPTPEPPHRINQIYLEPILFAHAEATPGVTILTRTQFDSLTQTETGVTIAAHHLDSGEAVQLFAQYAVGCDGGKSAVRHQIGSRLLGTAMVQRVQSTYIRAPSLLAQLQSPPAWANFSLNPRRSGNVYAIDGRETWLLHNYLRPNELDFNAIDRDWAIRAILGVDQNFKYDILSKEDWIGRRLIADKFRERRVFLCGDAAHIWVPYAGYGMNAGLADAENLGWLLAAHVNGWAPANILQAYERERQPITEQVSYFVMNHAHAMTQQRAAVSAEIEDDTLAGAAARRALGQATYDLNVQQYCAAGLNFGYFYAASPLIAYDGEPAPDYSMGSFTPSTVPGCRTPHLWLEDGRSLYDALGCNYGLLRFDHAVAVDGLLGAAAACGVPLRLLDIAPSAASQIYRHKLLLSRPDQHVAWRGNAPPADPLALIDLLRGVDLH